MKFGIDLLTKESFWPDVNFVKQTFHGGGVGNMAESVLKILDRWVDMVRAAHGRKRGSTRQNKNVCV
jgi:hypothetical protein